ncbi:MAG: AarF/UbiB family protein [Mariprofundaceae bacterium]|nr:AarF/UbiB family protein [Mariprofundaceae bacterium]
MFIFPLIQRTYRLIRTAWAVKALRQADSDDVKQQARHALSEILAGSRGLPMKVGQVLAGMGDTSEYAALTQSIEPWSLKKMLPVLAQAWGKPPLMILESIEESHAAASLGQVHRAKLNARETLAIKIQYPDIAKAMQAEMTLAGLMPAAGPAKTWDFDMQAYKQAFNQNIHEELDYLHEMKQQMLFSASIHVQGLHVPTTYPWLCRKNILVQSWAAGVRLSEVAKWSLPDRLFVARTLMQTMFQSLFQAGLVHGDPHPGNMLFSNDGKEPQTTLLDFGCMIHIDEMPRLALLNMILVARGDRHINLLPLFASMGFDESKLHYIEAKLPTLIQLLCRPFMEERAFDVEQWDVSASVELLLGDDKWWFRSAAPAKLFLIIRIFQGLLSQLALLDVKLPWFPLLQQALKQSTWEDAKHWTPKGIHLPEPPEVQGSATQLSIHIQPHGKNDINITLTAVSALDLENLMPETIASDMRDAGVHLSDIREKLLKEGLEPQTLLDLEMPSYHCHIALLS